MRCARDHAAEQDARRDGLPVPDARALSRQTKRASICGQHVQFLADYIDVELRSFAEQTTQKLPRFFRLELTSAETQSPAGPFLCMSLRLGLCGKITVYGKRKFIRYRVQRRTTPRSRTPSIRPTKRSRSDSISRAARRRSSSRKKTSMLTAEDETKLRNMNDILQGKLVKRGISLKGAGLPKGRARRRRHSPSGRSRSSREFRSKRQKRSSSSSRTRSTKSRRRSRARPSAFPARTATRCRK